jgi:PAS domain S-box-containing protein
MIVEDERLIARCIKNSLERLGYTVPAVAATGEEALARFGEVSPDLVLMDIVLKGGMDGIETARRLRARSQVPVVYLTGHHDLGLVERAKETEPLGFLLKPYEEPELHAAVETALHRHRLEQRVRETERWLHGTLTALQDAVIATDVLQRIGFMNPAAERLTGWTASEAAEYDLERVLHILGGEAASAVAVTERRTMETGATAALPDHATLFDRNGKQVLVEGCCSPIVHDDGFYMGFVWVLRPIGSGKAGDDRRERPAPQSMPAETAHELNNLLTSVLGNASLTLSRMPESDPNLPSLLNIHAAALRTMSLVRRTQSGARQDTHLFAAVDVSAAVAKVCAALPQLVSSAIALDYRPGSDIWPIHSSSELVEELLINLCLSACEALPRGGKLLLETENVSLSEDDAMFRLQARSGDYVRLRLCDNGRGLAPTARARFFADSSDSADAAPTGFDTVRELVRQHRGWIECYSEPGNGTRIDVYLPRLEQPHEEFQASVIPDERKTVLLVDDEQMLRDLGFTILNSGGFEVLLANDGRQALEIFARERYRIGAVVLDLSLPHFSGDATFQELVKLDSDVRVIFCSGYPGDHVRSLGERQVCGFISKPYRNRELLDAVRAACASFGGESN